MEKVSIIVPVYNVEEYIANCLDSLVKQTYKNIEIILVDDGSTDNSLKICQSYEKIDNRIKVFHKQNGGLGSARNFGIENSDGKYITFLDSDDYIDNNTIELMMNNDLEKYDIVCCGFDRVDQETKKVYSKEMIKMPFDELIIDETNIMETAFLSPSGWGKLFSRNIIGDIRFSQDKRAIEDILFYLEIMTKVPKIKYVKKILWHYMVRKNSLIMSITSEKADIFEKDLLNIKEKYEDISTESYLMNYLTLQVIIHNCISIPTRLYNNKENINKRIYHIKKYMKKNFPNWKNIKINIKGRKIKKLTIYTILLMYRLNSFIVFIVLYNFMINTLKFDIKW